MISLFLIGLGFAIGWVLRSLFPGAESSSGYASTVMSQAADQLDGARDPHKDRAARRAHLERARQILQVHEAHGVLLRKVIGELGEQLDQESAPS